MSTSRWNVPRTLCGALAVEAVCMLLLGAGCASWPCEPDADAEYGPCPENWKEIALDHFLVVHKGPHFKVEHGGDIFTFNKSPSERAAMTADGKKVHGWLVELPLRRYRNTGDGLVERTTGYSGVLIRDGKVLWCDCNG